MLPQARPCVRVDTRLGPLPGLPGARPSLCFHEANQEPDEAPRPSQGIERERTPGSRRRSMAAPCTDGKWSAPLRRGPRAPLGVCGPRARLPGPHRAALSRIKRPVT